MIKKGPDHLIHLRMQFLKGCKQSIGRESGSDGMHGYAISIGMKPFFQLFQINIHLPLRKNNPM